VLGALLPIALMLAHAYAVTGILFCRPG
jgi:hypothetical protein